MEKKYLKKVPVKKQNRLPEILDFMTENQKQELLKTAEFLKGEKILHINATEKGGGVAELLKSIVSCLNALDIKTEWNCISPLVGKNFFEITNKIHNSLQGANVKITKQEWLEYEKINKAIAVELDKKNYDILAINDPQPLFAGQYLQNQKQKIFFCHIDTSSASKPVFEKLLPIIKSYQKIIFSNSNFVAKNLPSKKIRIFTPAIDPLSPKQKIVPKKQARVYLQKHGGIPVAGPLIVQVSRFDVWKNPIGVIQAFRIVKLSYPQAKLALVGFNEAADNPKAAGVFKDIKNMAKKSNDIFVFFDPKNKDALKFTIMAQNSADVVVQNSIKEGFGLTATEAMWKGHAVIAGPASGLKRQITNSKNGFIVKNSSELAKKIILLLQNPQKKEKMGQKAKKTVIKNFLLGRLLLDHLKIYKSCLKK